MSDDRNTVKYWLDRGIAPSLAAAVYLDVDADWKIGDPAVDVSTRSGASYSVSSDGTMSGGSRDIASGKLIGATSAGSTLLRTQCIVVGLQMEFAWNGSRYHSSTVESIEKRP